jgi:histidinol-phosphate aminotransferase
MSRVLDLARPELRALRPYVPGAYEPEYVRLNANESPWRLPGDGTDRGLNVYPPPRPTALAAALAAWWRVDVGQLLVARGSSEAIDVLIRGFCTAGQDRIVVCPPTFDMYRHYASIQGAAVTEVPLDRSRKFAFDTDAVLEAVDGRTKIVFVCSPNNPTGASVPRGDVERLCAELAGRALVVIDEAYHEFSDSSDFLDLRKRYEHVVLLRTLSKCVSLAGARCGALLASPEVIGFLSNVLPPYTFPTPSIELVLQALGEESLRVSMERIALIKRERQRLAEALLDVPDVLEVYPSHANFLLVETRDGPRFMATAHRAGILLRRFPSEPGLENCVRVTIGQPKDNDRLLQALSGAENLDAP